MPRAPQARRTMSAKKAITILQKLIDDARFLSGEPFASPRRSQWTDTARGALEHAGASDSLLQSFDAAQSMVFSPHTSDEEMRNMSNSNLASMSAVLGSAIEQLGWTLVERPEDPVFTPVDDKPVQSSASTFHVGDAHFLIVDGEVWRDTRVNDEDHLRQGTFYDSSVPKVAKLSFRDLAGYFDLVDISLPNDHEALDNWEFGRLIVELYDAEEGKSVIAAFRIEYDLEFWANPYSISDLATAIEKALSRHTTRFEYWQRDENTAIAGFGVSVSMSLDSPVQEALDLQPELMELVPRINAELDEKDRTAVNALFDFPAPIKNACEQYLLYFVQFLSDLGIQANAEVKEQANKVLFRVKPVDEKEALNNIREALQIYLGLPLAPEFSAAASSFRDVAVSQLHANVLHLQSQIMMAKAAIEMQNAALGAKDAHIALLQERIDLRAFQPQIQLKSSNAEAEKEDLVKDVLAVKKYDFKFLEINFPEVLRKLKRKLK